MRPPALSLHLKPPPSHSANCGPRLRAEGVRWPHAVGVERTSVRFAVTAARRLFLSARTAVALDDIVASVGRGRAATSKRPRPPSHSLVPRPQLRVLDRCTPLRWENLATNPASLSYVSSLRARCGRLLELTPLSQQARIKKIIQADEDVGKVAQATPVVVCELSCQAWKRGGS